MSFLRHGDLFPDGHWDLEPGKNGNPMGVPVVTHRYNESVEYSWQVALQQSLLTLSRP